jgi:RimJ/RimL family protein N-acetyltransferase
MCKSLEKRYESDRLYLKKINISEINEEIMSWFDNKDLMRYYTNSKNKITKDVLINSIEEGNLDGTNYTYGIYYTENDECIGTVKIGPINKIHKISDLVALIGNIKYHGKGLAVEAISLGNKIAFEVYDLRKLFGGMYENNVASIKAYTRAGWKIEGTLKGHYYENGNNIDRVLVGCFNPKYFTKE